VLAPVVTPNLVLASGRVVALKPGPAAAWLLPPARGRGIVAAAVALAAAAATAAAAVPLIGDVPDARWPSVSSA